MRYHITEIDEKKDAIKSSIEMFRVGSGNLSICIACSGAFSNNWGGFLLDRKGWQFACRLHKKSKKRLYDVMSRDTERSKCESSSESCTQERITLEREVWWGGEGFGSEMEVPCKT